MPFDTDQIAAVNEKIRRFQFHLNGLSALQVVRKHVLGGECFVLSEDEYFDLRCEIASEFRLHPNEVLVVGSAKLGFSIVPRKRYRHFGDESDVDVVIVSPILFDKVWEAAFEYWKSGAFWTKQEDFKKYLFRGWIRPDKLPPSTRFSLSRDWWDFFQGLTQSKRYSPYKMAGALYRSWYFLENYQINCVENCQQEQLEQVRTSE